MADNKELIDFVLWPFRASLGILKLCLWLVLVFSVLFFWSFSWLFFGDSNHRKEVAYYQNNGHAQERIIDFREAAVVAHSKVQSTDLTNSDSNPNLKVEYENQDTDQGTKQSTNQADHNSFQGTDSFKVTNPENGQMLGSPLYCTEPGQGPGKYDDQALQRTNDNTEISLHNIDVSWIERKSGKLYRAYALSAMMVTTMRQYLASLKYGGNYYIATCMTHKGDETIHLNHAPIIDIRIAQDQEDTLFEKDLILGMWIDGQGTAEDKNPDATHHFADVSNPVLTPGQRKALEALYELRDPDFWVAAAHENGISKKYDGIISHRADILNGYLDKQLPGKYRNELLEVLASPIRR